MKILHICNYIQPQLGYQEYFLAKEQARMGHDVFVIAADRYYPFPDYENTVKSILGERIIGAGTEQYEGFTIIRLNLSFEIGTQVWLKGMENEVRNIKPDLVICHGMAHFNSLRIIPLKKELGFRLIYDDHGLFLYDSKNPVIKLYYKLFFNFKKIRKHADKIIGVADECAEYIHKKYNIPREEILMIPLGSDIELFKNDAKAGQDTRKKLSIDKNDFVIIYTGKITESKGVHLILEAINKIKREQKIVMVAVGSGHEDYLSHLAGIKLNHDARYIKVDSVSNKELFKYYSASDIAVWPNQATIGTIEAMSCSLPVVCNKILKERYEGGNGFGITPGSVEELVKVIEFFIDNPDKKKEMAALSRKVVEERFSWKVIAKEFLE